MNSAQKLTSACWLCAWLLFELLAWCTCTIAARQCLLLFNQKTNQANHCTGEHTHVNSCFGETNPSGSVFDSLVLVDGALHCPLAWLEPDFIMLIGYKFAHFTSFHIKLPLLFAPVLFCISSIEILRQFFNQINPRIFFRCILISFTRFFSD